MAANRTVTTLSIALIIFVMLTFALAISTYLFFQQRLQFAGELVTEREQKAELQRTMQTLQTDLGRLQAVIGTTKKDADTIEAEQNEWFATRFGTLPEADRNYLGLINWLDQGRTEANKTTSDADSRHRAELEKLQAAVTKAEEATAAAEKAKKEAEDKLAAEAEQFKKDIAAGQERMQGLLEEQKKALAQTERMGTIVEELRKLGPQLPPDLRRRYEAAAPDGEPEPWPERIRAVLAELSARERTIRDLNTMLAALRVADNFTVAPAVRPGDSLQKTVLASTPADDRIDGFDGRVVAIDERDRTATIACQTTEGIRAGMLFLVFEPGDPRPRVGSRKGLVQVASVESGTLVRARIREASIENPILAGDGVATSLWRPGESPEIVIVGAVPLGDDMKQGMKSLVGLVDRNGGTVVDAVSPRTSVLVDAGEPRAAVKGWTNTDANRRKTALDRAKQLGVRVIGLDALFDMLGLDPATAAAGSAGPRMAY